MVLPIFLQALFELAAPYEGPVVTVGDALSEMQADPEDPVHLDPLEDVEVPEVTDEMVGAGRLWDQRYHISIDGCIRFMQVIITQTDQMRSFVASLLDCVGRELVHQVTAYSSLVDAVDALDRFVDRAWSVASDVEHGKIPAVDSLFATLAPWTDDFKHMLTVPAPLELPSLFQSFDELCYPEAGESGAADRVITIGNWIKTFESLKGDRPSPSGPGPPPGCASAGDWKSVQSLHPRYAASGVMCGCDLIPMRGQLDP